MKKIIYFFVLLIFISCNKEAPTENPLNPDKKNILRREIIDNVFLFVDSLKDNYTLDDYIYADVHLKNENNLSGLPILISSYPPFLSWVIKNSSDELVNAGPLIVGESVYNDTLKIGEEITSNIKWFQNIYDKNELTSGLKAFAGEYTLNINFRGIDYQKSPYLIKYFRISEIGDPLSSHIFRDYNSNDTLKIDFILRNRINSTITLTPSSDSCVLFIIDKINNQNDTVYTHNFLLEKSVYNLPALSDNILYKFRYLKQDFIDRGIKGGFDIVIELNFQERKITSRNLLFIL